MNGDREVRGYQFFDLLALHFSEFNPIRGDRRIQGIRVGDILERRLIGSCAVSGHYDHSI